MHDLMPRTQRSNPLLYAAQFSSNPGTVVRSPQIISRLTRRTSLFRQAAVSGPIGEQPHFYCKGESVRADLVCLLMNWTVEVTMYVFGEVRVQSEDLEIETC
jgi:hypothetical protein